MANVGVTFDFKAMEAIIDIEVAKVSAPIARRLASRTFERAKQNVIKEVSRHPISEELESPTFNSKFIVGGDHPKSLFGFFGFQEGTHPVEELLEHIQEDFWIKTDSPMVNRQYNFPFNYLGIAELEALTPLHWSSRSWLKAVENGLSNIANFISMPEVGRSSFGIQIKNSLKNPGEFLPTPYMTPIIKEFIQTLKDAKDIGAYSSSEEGQKYYNIRNAGGRFTK